MQTRLRAIEINIIKTLISVRTLFVVMLMFVAFAINNIGGIKCYFTASHSALNEIDLSATYTVHFDANQGTGTMSDQIIFVGVNTPLTANAYTRTGYAFDGWNTAADGLGTPYTDTQSVTDLTTQNSTITLYAQWTQLSGVAVVNGQYYDTLQEAVNAVPANSATPVTVTLLCSVNECITVAKNSNILFDFQNYTVTNNENKSTITNNGSIIIQNGILTKKSSTQPAVINNNPGASLTITGGSILAVGSTKSQAIYNDGASLEISGTAILNSESTNRATVTSVNGGTTTIKGGTIISQNYSAVSNISISGSTPGDTIIVGTEDESLDTSSPVIQGKVYAINSSANGVSLYDGILKGKSKAINNTAYIVDKESGCSVVYGTETIDGETYKNAYLTPNNVVTFEANGGNVDNPSKYVDIGDPVGSMPTPVRPGFVFDGWYTDPTAGTLVTESTIVTGSDIYYAHWREAVTVTFNVNGGTVSPTQISVAAGDTLGTMPLPLKSRNRFDGWYTEPTNGTEVTANTPITQNIQLYARWTTIDAARVNGVEYPTLQDAIDQVPKTGVETTVELLCYDEENVIVATGQNIVFDFGSNTLKNEGNAAVIENDGTIKITNGTITSSAGYSAIDNNNALVMTGGSIIATGTRQAIYNKGGTVEISGSTYLESQNLATDQERGTVQNLNNGTVIIKGGTIVAKKVNGVYNAGGTLTIGENDGTVSTSSPVIQGAKCGIKNAGTLNFYDGIVKVPTAQTLISGTVTDKPADYDFVNGTETISGTNYKTTYLDATP